MPELPEVETLRHDLQRVIVGKTIKSVKGDWPKMVRPLSLQSLNKKISGKKVVGILRIGKMLVITLSGGNFLTIHLKLTGQLIYQPKVSSRAFIVGGHPQAGGTKRLPNTFTHLIFSFRDGSTLFFNDQRKFGWARLVNKEKLDTMVGTFGVEPLSKDFTLVKFKEILARYPNRKIKQLLLDQTLIAGLGNIYVDESCWGAKVLPTRVVSTLTSKEVTALHKCIPKVLKLSISKKGTSFRNYIQLDGKEGKMVSWLNVYNKKNQRCKRCGQTIKKIKLNGRGTHFCPGCQK